MSKFLFLDIDGVMHSTNDNDIKYEHATKLDSVIENSNVQIIISSSWRFHMNIEKIKSYFPLNTQKKILDVTGDAFIGKYARYNEICNYLKNKNKTLEDWVALDDAFFEFPDNCEQLIHCSSNYGLTQRELNILKNWLRN